ncbi:hypothetical protein [Luteococcus sp.]|uniref:hypothetical protein n=1 Tax=Luteococcus sp. TaxID=1969402 RepID=UPI0037353A63
MLGFLVARYVRRNAAQCLALAGMFLLLTFTVCGLGLLRGHVVSALDDSMALSQGGNRVAVTTTDAAGAAVLSKAGFHPVREDRVTVAGDAGDASVSARLLADAAAGVPGRMLEGRAVAAVGEAVVSRELSGHVGARVGSSLEIQLPGRNPTRVRVVGLSVDPVDPSWERVVALLPDTVPRDQSSLWLGSADLASVADDPAHPGRFRGVEVKQQFGDENANPVVSAISVLTTAGRVVAAAACVLMVALLSTLRSSSRTVVDGLVGAGMSSRAAWSVLHAAWAVVMTGAGVAGVGLLLAVQGVGLDALAGLFGQSWAGVKVPAASGAAMMLIAVVLPLVWSFAVAVRSGATSRRSVLRLDAGAGRSKLSALTLAVCAVAAVGLVMLTVGVLLHITAVPSPLHGLWLGLVVALTIPAWLNAWNRRRHGRNVSRVVNHLTRRTRATAGVVAVALFVSLCWALTVDRMAESSTGKTASDAALQIVDVPPSIAPQLAQEYSRAGGSSDVYAMVKNPSQGEVLAVDPAFAQCAQHHPRQLETCPDPNATTVVLDDADPQRVNTPTWWSEDQNISLAVLDDNGTVAQLTNAPRNRQGSPRADAASVVLVGARSTAARKAHLETAGPQFVVLNGYEHHDTATKAHLRSYLFNVTPTAFPQSNSNSAEAPLLHSLAWSAVLCAGILGLSVALLTAVSETRSQAPNIQALQGISRTTSTTIRHTVLSAYLSAGLLVPALAALSSWLSLPHTGQGITAIWTIPIMLTILTSPIVILATRQDAAMTSHRHHQPRR